MYELSFEELEQTCKACRACSLCQTRTNVVFGVGNRNADILFVGEGPGEQEDLTGEPFVGRAGQLLDLYLKAFDLPRESVYITNIVKCRPPKNRDPMPEEEAACMGFLERQIELIQPKLIVCLGRIAAMKLIKPDFRIMKEHGVWFERGGIPIMATLHPAALLRDPGKKEIAFEDFKNLLKKREDLA
ncbi:MAG: uracil-DNA glycosylase [Clostridia bacterium]|nr:uracil-DNA glycosylase [Clostridia bacterium]